MEIKPIILGLPRKTATKLIVLALSFDTQATTSQLYYELQSDENLMIINGYLNLSEEQFNNWSSDNTFIEDIVLNYLELERL